MIVRVIISVLAFVFIGLHFAYPALEIDLTTFAFFALATLSWLGTRPVGGAKLPKLDLQKMLEELGQKAKDVWLTSHMSAAGGSKPYSFSEVSRTNPALAMVGLRIELEKNLKDLAARHNVSHSKRGGIYPLMYRLFEKNIISLEERSILTDLINTLNKAAHGEPDERASEWVMSMGPAILANLEQRVATPHQAD